MATARDVDADNDNRRPTANSTDMNTVIYEDAYGHLGACLKLTQHQLQKQQKTKTGATKTTTPTTVEQTNKTPEQNPNKVKQQQRQQKSSSNNSRALETTNESDVDVTGDDITTDLMAWAEDLAAWSQRV